MRQRLGIAQAFLGDPELLVLDEPMNGLDPGGILQIREMIREHAAQRGTTFFISSHILAEMELLCTRVGFVDEGRTVAQGTLEELGAAGRLHLRLSDPASAKDLLLKRWPDAALMSDGIALQAGEEDVPDLVRMLVEQGHDLYEITRRARSLEEIFMELTGRGR
jgi:ABC-2 type transport system ATP-binding protein